MSEKRRGLGRGLGALIPSTPPAARNSGDRPVDVFFPERPDTADGAAVAGPGTAPTALKERDPRPERTTAAAAPVVDRVTTVTRPAPAPDAALPADAAPDAAPVATPAQARDAGGADDSAGRPAGGVSAGANGTSEADVELVPVPGARFAELPVDAIRPNPRQPRQVFDEEALAELVHSVREVGILQPVVVRPAGEQDGQPRYELIMGERRLRATQEAGLERIPAIIRDTSDDALLRDALLENLHRSQLNALEEAAAYQQLLDDFGCTHEDLAARIGRSRPQISNTIRLLKLPPLVQRRVAAGVLSAGHARALLGLEDAAAMERLAQRIVSEGLSVRTVEEMVALGDGPVERTPKRRPRPGGHMSELDDLASRLGDQFDTRVAVTLGRNRGRLSIDFASVDDLNRILGLIAPDVRGLFKSAS